MDELNNIFEALAGSLNDLVPAGAASSDAGATLQTAAGTQSIAAAQSILGPLQSVLAPSAAAAVQAASSSSSVGSTLETVALDVLKSGFGLAPIIGGLLGLFGGGGDSSSPPPLMKYQMPDQIQYQAAEVGGQIESGDYSQAGVPRGFGAPAAAAATVPAGGAAMPGITVNVQAMDARSFLDRSSDIAAAVKDAMLNLNSINDVVNDL